MKRILFIMLGLMLFVSTSVVMTQPAMADGSYWTEFTYNDRPYIIIANNQVDDDSKISAAEVIAGFKNNEHYASVDQDIIDIMGGELLVKTLQDQFVEQAVPGMCKVSGVKLNGLVQFFTYLHTQHLFVICETYVAPEMTYRGIFVPWGRPFLMMQDMSDAVMKERVRQYLTGRIATLDKAIQSTEQYDNQLERHMLGLAGLSFRTQDVDLDQRLELQQRQEWQEERVGYQTLLECINSN